jgi:hypothetical protein
MAAHLAGHRSRCSLVIKCVCKDKVGNPSCWKPHSFQCLHANCECGCVVSWRCQHSLKLYAGVVQWLQRGAGPMALMLWLDWVT